MMFAVVLRFLSFVAYLLFFFAIPFGVLWEWAGLGVGLFFFAAFLIALKYKAFERIAKRLGAEPLSVSEEPVLFTLLTEHCRRLDLPVPKVFILCTEAINTAVFGFSHERSALVVTRGLLARLSREQLSAVIARQLISIWHRDNLGASWLSQFLAFVDGVTRLGSKNHDRMHHGHEHFSLFVKRVIFYPLAIFPSYILGQGTLPAVLDQESAAISRKPFELAEALRMMEALQDRNPLFVRFSLRHLFLVAPSSIDPVVGVLFKSTPLKYRVKALLTSELPQKV